MLSDTLFDGTRHILVDLAQYAMADADYYNDNREPLFYYPDQYDEALRRLVPIMDMQIALDGGCDPEPVDEETELRLMCRMVEHVVDIIQTARGTK